MRKNWQNDIDADDFSKAMNILAQKGVLAIWTHSIKLLECQVDNAYELSGWMFEHIAKSDMNILFFMYAQIMTTNKEILHLLDGGYPNGAYARVRRIYELWVITAFINRVMAKEIDKDIIQKYVDHEKTVNRSLLKEMVDGQTKLRELGKLSPEEKMKLDEMVNILERADLEAKALDDMYKVPDVKLKYRSQYGWAIAAIREINGGKLESLSFKDLENFVGVDAYRVLRILGNKVVHGGYITHDYNGIKPEHVLSYTIGQSRWDMAPSIIATSFILSNFIKLISLLKWSNEDFAKQLKDKAQSQAAFFDLVNKSATDANGLLNDALLVELESIAKEKKQGDGTGK